MNSKQVRTVVGSILLGLVFFGVVMGISMSLVMLNASQSPQIVWFPLPATAVLAGAIWWAQRRWGIGLEHPRDVPWARVYAIGFALTVLGLTVALVQGKFTGMVRATELLDAEVSPLFLMTYAIFMSVLAAILAEATFRGVVQTRMQTVLSVWPTVIIIGVVNVLAHRWGPELTLNWLGLFVTLAGWTYLRWLSRSLWPPLILHTVVNVLVAVGLWFRGPFVQADLATGTVIVIAAAGLIALAVAVGLARGMPPPGSTA
ncbi:MAG: CPBP family intramembrane metalloprotease [Gammaproteobacteria bacterium]|nr:MAG: CPBP family intramembrane metalloprotease [Gammaproteobacteria bacterium]